MHMRRFARAAVAAVGLAALAAATPAAAAGTKLTEPLNQYVVSGKVNPEDLARKGFDLTEAQAQGQARLRDRRHAVAGRRPAGKDVTVRPLARERTTAKVAAPNPLTDPDARLRRLPALEPEAGAVPARPARRRSCPSRTSTTISRGATPTWSRSTSSARACSARTSSPTRSPRTRATSRTAAAPPSFYDSTQHAREWIAAEIERRLFEYVLENKNQTARLQRQGPAAQDSELWFVPIVNPDGYDYTFTAPATRLWRKNLRDNNGDGAITNVDGVDTNRNWPTKWNYDLEGASDDPTSETFHGSRPGLRARGQGAARASSSSVDPASSSTTTRSPS